MKLKNTYTLKARKDGVVTLDVASVIEPNPDAPPLKAGPMSISHSFSGKQKGTIELDAATGWIVGGTLNRDVSGTVQVEGGDHAAEPMKMFVSIKKVTRFEQPK